MPRTPNDHTSTQAERSYAILEEGREGRIAGVLTIVDGLRIAQEMAAEIRERGTAVTVMRWNPPT